MEAVITDKVDALYYETCQKCGKRFDLVVDEFEFECIVKGTDLVDQWNSSGQILCCDCALEDVEKM